MSRSSLRSGAGALCRRLVVGTPLLAIALALGTAALPVSQARATSFELQPFAAYALFDNDINIKDHIGFGGTAGLYFGHFGIEGNYTTVSTEVDTGLGAGTDIKFK